MSSPAARVTGDLSVLVGVRVGVLPWQSLHLPASLVPAPASFLPAPLASDWAPPLLLDTLCGATCILGPSLALGGGWRLREVGRRSKGQGPRATLTAALRGPLSECGGHEVPWKSTHFPQGQFPWAVAWTHISYLRGIPIGPFGVACHPWTHHDGQRPASVRCPSPSALDPEFPRGKAEGDWTGGRQASR